MGAGRPWAWRRHAAPRVDDAGWREDSPSSLRRIYAAPWKLDADLNVIGSQYLVGDESNQNPKMPA